MNHRCRQCLHKINTQTNESYPMIKTLLSWFFSPLLFGIAFMAPLSAQILDAMAVSLPVANIWAGLVIGLGLGLMAQFRGSWIWIKP